jgi:voltage-gated potassium channel
MAKSPGSLLRVRLLYHYVRLFTRSLLLLLVLLIVGTVGYVVLEDYTFFEGLYMTVISITTVGFSEVRPLSDAGRDFLVIEKNSESPVARLAAERKVAWALLFGDALSEDVLREARIDLARGLFSVLPTDADNLFVVLSARGLNPTIWIETRIAHETTRAKMIQAGANRVISPYHVAGTQMARSMLKPQVDDFIEIFSGDRHYEFEAKIHRLTEDDASVGKSVGTCRYMEQGFSVVALQDVDGTMVYAPQLETTLKAGMSVFLLGKGRN